MRHIEEPSLFDFETTNNDVQQSSNIPTSTNSNKQAHNNAINSNDINKEIISNNNINNEHQQNIPQPMTQKEQFINLLRSTKRPGIENVIAALEKTDFYEAPASTTFHGNYPGGLLEHSLNVYKVACLLSEAMLKLKPECAAQLPQESIIITALLHDICKANIYKTVKRNRKNALGYWEEYETYTVDYSELPLGHAEKSVIRLLRCGLELTNDELLAIRWHMGAWDLAFQSAEMKSNIAVAKDASPLLAIIQAADGLASSIMEEVKK